MEELGKALAGHAARTDPMPTEEKWIERRNKAIAKYENSLTDLVNISIAVAKAKQDIAALNASQDPE